MTQRRVRELKTLPDGRKLFGVEEEGVETIDEQWNVYRLTDGSTVRVKATLSGVFRVVDEQGNPIHDEAGEPQVYVDTSVAVVAPEAHLINDEFSENALAEMAADPDIQRELALIQSEFAVTDSDGLADDR